jgi:NADP-dependent 3-hydroxy acid dehydrogenase YdfG
VGYGAHAADEEAAAACVDFSIERFGSADILVNNAGTNPAFGPVVGQARARFTKTIEVNLWAPILWTQLTWRAWMAEHGGRVTASDRASWITGGTLVMDGGQILVTATADGASERVAGWLG